MDDLNHCRAGDVDTGKPAGRRRLKLGLFLDGFDVPAWAYRALELTQLSGCAEFSLVILNGSHRAAGSRSRRSGVSRKAFLYDVYNRIDRRLFRLEPDPFAPGHVRKLLAGVPVLVARAARNPASQSLGPEDTDAVRGHDLDILVLIGPENLRGDILKAARYGVWAWHRGEAGDAVDDPPGFWEVIERRPVTASALRVLADDLEQRRVLCQSHWFTYPLSPTRNRHYSFWASSSHLPRQIESLHRYGPDRFFNEKVRRDPESDSGGRRQRGIPSNRVALRVMAGMAARIMREAAGRALRRDAWFLLLGKTDGSRVRPGEFKPVFPPGDRFWADPHLTTLNDRLYIFVEEYPYSKKKGHISVIEVDREGNCGGSIPVLEKPYHLSYPSVFEWQGRHFMVPESGQNKTIDLYECVDFPLQWRHRITLMDGLRAVDTTLFNYRDKWWLFTAIAECEGSYPQVELFLYFSSDLFSRTWRPHPLNPILSDIRRARPAGRIFSRNGKIYRPSQYCTTTYGYGFDLNEIVVLSDTEYVEKRAVSVRPDWDRRILATHTYASEGEITVVDALTRRRGRGLG